MTKVYNCRVCGEPCVKLDEIDEEALGLNDADCFSWSVVHLECARREHQEKRKDAP